MSQDKCPNRGSIPMARRRWSAGERESEGAPTEGARASRRRASRGGRHSRRQRTFMAVASTYKSRAGWPVRGHATPPSQDVRANVLLGQMRFPGWPVNFLANFGTFGCKPGFFRVYVFRVNAPASATNCSRGRSSQRGVAPPSAPAHWRSVGHREREREKRADRVPSRS